MVAVAAVCVCVGGDWGDGVGVDALSQGNGVNINTPKHRDQCVSVYLPDVTPLGTTLTKEVPHKILSTSHLFARVLLGVTVSVSTMDSHDGLMVDAWCGDIPTALC